MHAHTHTHTHRAVCVLTASTLSITSSTFYILVLPRFLVSAVSVQSHASSQRILLFSVVQQYLPRVRCLITPCCFALPYNIPVAIIGSVVGVRGRAWPERISTCPRACAIARLSICATHTRVIKARFTYVVLRNAAQPCPDSLPPWRLLAPRRTSLAILQQFADLKKRKGETSLHLSRSTPSRIEDDRGRPDRDAKCALANL